MGSFWSTFNAMAAATNYPACKGCACAFSWIHMALSIAGIGVSFYWTAVMRAAIRCDIADSYSLLAAGSVMSSSLKIGGDMKDFAVGSKFDNVFQIETEVTKAVKKFSAVTPSKASASPELLCSRWDDLQDRLKDSVDPGSRCLAKAGCHPCEQAYKDEVCGSNNFIRAAQKCHKDACAHATSAYLQIFIVFIIMLVGNIIVGCATCTCCDTCGGNTKGGPAAANCLLGGCLTATLIGLVSLILGVMGMTSKWIGLLRYYDPTGSAATALLIPCYLAILSGVLAESQAYPDYSCYAASKAAPNLAGGAAPAVGTVVQPAKGGL